MPQMSPSSNLPMALLTTTSPCPSLTTITITIIKPSDGITDGHISVPLLDHRDPWQGIWNAHLKIIMVMIIKIMKSIDQDHCHDQVFIGFGLPIVITLLGFTLGKLWWLSFRWVNYPCGCGGSRAYHQSECIWTVDHDVRDSDNEKTKAILKFSHDLEL